MVNSKVRIAIIEAGLRNYEVAAKMGVAPETFSKWLQTELSEEKEKRILEAIDNLRGRPGMESEEKRMRKKIDKR
jgi:DNA-binding LacI/PurR family transcriptional regulator